MQYLEKRKEGTYLGCGIGLCVCVCGRGVVGTLVWELWNLVGIWRVDNVEWRSGGFGFFVWIKL